MSPSDLHVVEHGPADATHLWLLRRQGTSVGYRDQWELIEHDPRATFAVIDRAGDVSPWQESARPATVE